MDACGGSAADPRRPAARLEQPCEPVCQGRPSEEKIPSSEKMQVELLGKSNKVGIQGSGRWAPSNLNECDYGTN